MKSYLIEAQAPLAGCVEYYAAYAKDDSFEMTDEWLDTEREICEDLWFNYGYLLHLEDYSEEEVEEEGYESYEDFEESQYLSWLDDCNINISECSEEELDDYAPGGGHLDVIYDERTKNE